METPNAINDNPSWHLADSLSLDTWKVIPMTTVKQILRETDNEFELRYQQTFSDLTSQLHITPGRAYQSFEQEMYELFRDGVNWDSWQSIDKEMQVLVSQITTWMATYLNDHLEPWIQENGGWNTFSQKGQGRFNRWSLMGMTSAGIALLGSLFSS
ncbi:hypothetical protein JEQ12_006400 [Ovis aries]|uniref:Bcl-2 Bcl-2 homology region 1-3 domain-containing protein n=1 Tax=Ovis aries TaxID=9940 RepID=A0A836A097_SHEEP|nr:hypothetical protein JEQ12_006400 [Ovis aries]